MGIEENNKRVVVLPDYLDGQEDHIKHEWRKWEALGHKIDNYPGRYQQVVQPKTGEVKTFDCKTPPGIMKKSLRNFGVSEEDFKSVMKITDEMQTLKTAKGKQNLKWSSAVFGKKSGDKTILGIRSTELLDMFGKYYSVDEVKKIIQRDWGLAIKHETLREFYNVNLDKIERKRADYVLKGKETRLATDAGRLETLSILAWEIESKFNKSKSIEASKELRAIIEQIRKEVKGEEIRLTVDGKIDIQATMHANQSLQEALMKLPINMIVIGLTAAKQRINPANLIASLVYNYYSKFNGFNQLSDKGEILLPGHFIKNYDWGEIARKNESIIEDVQSIEVYENDVKLEQKPMIEDKRAKLLAILNQYKENAE